MEKVTGKEAVRNMEHLVKLLHKEWERSGRTKAAVTVTPGQEKEINAKIVEVISEKQGQLDNQEAGFKECMALSKDNFVLLRMAKKFKKAAERAAQKDSVSAYSVELDKEEYRLFEKVIGITEG